MKVSTLYIIPFVTDALLHSCVALLPQMKRSLEHCCNMLFCHLTKPLEQLVDEIAEVRNKTATLTKHGILKFWYNLR